MLQKTLKEETKTLHDQLESLMFVKEIMSKQLTLDQYKKNIIINYIVHKQFENDLFNNLSNEIKNKMNIACRKKLPALEKDIRQLNINNVEFLSGPILQQEIVKNDAFILGALYVLEGATLGGHVIAKNLSANSNFSDENIPLKYYKVYGDDLMNNWKSFVTILNEVPAENYQQAIDGAKMMFDKMIATAKIYSN